MKNVKITEENSPGLYVIVRCLDPICEFLGIQTKDFLSDHLYSCKKLYARIIPVKINDIETKLIKYESIINSEKNNKISDSNI